jgi:hypothetical protein
VRTFRATMAQPLTVYPVSKEAPSVVELNAEYERAVASLTQDPIQVYRPWEFFRLIVERFGSVRGWGDIEIADCLVRVAGIALAGAAWLRRAK